MCAPNTGGRQCDACQQGFFRFDAVVGCVACNCVAAGSVNESCDQTSGQCSCLPGVTGLKCDVCKDGFFSLTAAVGCQMCMCDSDGSVDSNCNKTTGICSCKVCFSYCLL